MSPTGPNAHDAAALSRCYDLPGSGAQIVLAMIRIRREGASSTVAPEPLARYSATVALEP